MGKRKIEIEQEDPEISSSSSESEAECNVIGGMSKTVGSLEVVVDPTPSGKCHLVPTVMFPGFGSPFVRL